MKKTLQKKEFARKNEFQQKNENNGVRNRRFECN